MYCGQRFEQAGEAFKCLIARCLVCGVGIGRIFTGAHKTVAGSVVGNGVVLLACGLHRLGRDGNRGIDACVVASVKPIDWRGDRRELGGWRSVEDEGCGKVFAMRRKGEGLATSPAEACSDEGPVRGRNLFSIVGCSIEVGIDLIGVESGDGFRGGVHAGEGIGVATIGPSAGEQVWGDNDVAGGGKLVGHLLGPVGEAEDLVNKDDDGNLLADLRVDDEGLQRTVSVFECDVFAVTRRGVQLCLGPLLA